MLQCFFLAASMGLGNPFHYRQRTSESGRGAGPLGIQAEQNGTIVPLWDAGVCGPEPENVVAPWRRHGKVLERGSGRGVTGNRSVGGWSQDRSQRMAARPEANGRSQGRTCGRSKDRKHWAHRPLGGKVQEGVRVCWQRHDARTASEHLAPFPIRTYEKGSNRKFEPFQRQLMHTASCTCIPALTRNMA